MKRSIAIIAVLSSLLPISACSNNNTAKSSSKASSSKLASESESESKFSYSISVEYEKEAKSSSESLKKSIASNSISSNAASSVSGSSSSSSEASSSASAVTDNSKKFEDKINKLNNGTAEYATYDKNSNTVTWTGFDAWNDYKDSDLQDMMDILQTITYRQAQHYNIDTPKIIVKTESGKLIAQASGGSDLQFAN